MLHASGTPQSVVLAQSAVAVSHTGDTNEFTLATITIPAGAMGANGQLEITTLWSCTNSANTKTPRVKFGGTSFTATALTTSGSTQLYTWVANRNSAASQVGHASANAGVGPTAGAVVTATVDTSADVALTLTGQLATGTETITLERYLVKLLKA